MTADGTATQPATPLRPADSVVEQRRRRVVPSPTDRTVRQVAAIDAWIAARRRREQALDVPGMSRDDRMDVAREVEVLRRTHDAIRGRCVLALDPDAGPRGRPGPTAVLAHRHTWFVDRLARLLGEQGVTVLVCTDNGAEALGAVVAEQPDLLLVGERLAMLSGCALLIRTRVYSPTTLRAAQAADGAQQAALHDVADCLFQPDHSPSHVADTLVTRHLAASS